MHCRHITPLKADLVVWMEMKQLALWSCVFALALLLQRGSFATGTEKLYLLTILPYPSDNPALQPSWNQGTNILPAAYLAVDMINNRSDVLSGYTLELINSDGGCDMEDIALESFVKHIIAERGQRPIVGIIGPGCSTSALAVSPQNSNPKIALLNMHIAGSPLLENRTKFAYSFGVLGSSYGFVNSTVALMRKANWRRIAVLYDEERVFFRSTYQALERDLVQYVPDAKIAFTSAVYETYLPVNEIDALDIRVIFVLAGPEFARKIMCLAWHRKLVFSRNQWIFYGREAPEFEEEILFSYLKKAYFCSDKDLKSAVDRNLFVNYQLQRHDKKVTKSGLTYDEYLTQYSERVEQYNRGEASYKALGDPSVNATENRYATVVFDEIWAFAFAMDKVQHLVNLTSYGLELGQTEHSNSIREVVYSHKFDGVSGNISFVETNGYTERIMEVYQVFGKNYTYIGNIRDQEFELDTAPELVRNEFQQDGLQLVHPAYAVILSLFTITVTALIIILHIVSIVYRDYPSIKAQSPKLNQISYVGAYMFASGTLFNILYKTIALDTVSYGNICQAIWPWLFSISFSVFFAPICARTWRLYRIFAHYLHPGPFISEPVLFSVVAIFVAIDVLLAIIWTSVDPFIGEEIKIDFDENGDFAIKLVCNCDYLMIWYALVYLLKCFLLIVTVVFALLTRSIVNNQFNTSSLRVFVYLFALIFTIGLNLYYFTKYLNRNIYIDYTILVLMNNILLLLTLLFVFLPPTYPLLKEKLQPTCSKNRKYFLDCIMSQVHLSSHDVEPVSPTSHSFLIS